MRQKLILWISALALSAAVSSVYGQSYYLPDDMSFSGVSYRFSGGEMFGTSDPDIYIHFGSGLVPRMVCLPPFNPNALGYNGGQYYAAMDGSRECWAYRTYDGSWRYLYPNGQTAAARNIYAGANPFRYYPRRVAVGVGVIDILGLNLGFAIASFTNLWLGYKFYDHFARPRHRSHGWYEPNYRPAPQRQKYYGNGRASASRGYSVAPSTRSSSVSPLSGPGFTTTPVTRSEVSRRSTVSSNDRSVSTSPSPRSDNRQSVAPATRSGSSNRSQSVTTRSSSGSRSQSVAPATRSGSNSSGSRSSGGRR